MRVRTRLLLTLAAVLLLASLPGWYAVQRIQAVRDIALELRSRQATAALAVGRFQVALEEIENAQRTYVIMLDSAGAPDLRAALANAEAQLRALQEAGYGEAAAPARAALTRFEAVAARMEALAAADEAEEATRFHLDVLPLYDEAGTFLDSISSVIDAGSNERALAAERISASAARWGLLFLLLGAVAAAAIGLHTSEDLAGALRRLRAAHARVGSGDDVAPDLDVPDDRPDEIGDLARSFRAMTDKLTELDRMKAEFVSMASHEIKAPAGMISSYAELLAEQLDPGDEEAMELLEAIRGQATALSRQIQQLLELTRLEAGAFPLRMEEVDTADFLESVAQAYRPLVRAAELDLRVRVEPSLPERIRVDPEALRIDVLGNLLGNALKFTEGGGKVRLEAWGEGPDLHLRLSDTGAGIPGEQLPYVFEKYYQAGQHAGKVGSGLGLAIARMVVESHGGHIGVESELGRGTTFSIVLPGVGVGAGDSEAGAA
ncbi:MAG TPA: HAMP domain-containing sensor histidine kinase [Longimicrobiales bacterium]|nr:HAMP domain-containing sensor histidine kinase [Longimicrobiales bacterium]